MNIVIEDMKQDDIEGKAYVHWKSWQETYVDLVDKNYLTNCVTLDGLRERTRENMDHTIVAKVDGTVVGFVKYGAYRNPDLTGYGEIYAIYVLQQYQNRKIGYSLMQEALKRMSGFSDIAVWVLRGNDKASTFYEKVGFAFDGTSLEIELGTKNVEERMIYHRA